MVLKYNQKCPYKIGEGNEKAGRDWNNVIDYKPRNAGHCQKLGRSMEQTLPQSLRRGLGPVDILFQRDLGLPSRRLWSSAEREKHVTYSV